MPPGRNLTAYISQERNFRLRVFFEGSTALVQGQGVCYNRDYGTAANVDGSRCRRVEMPSATNNEWFAGVTVKAYSAQTGGQFIEIFEPGSVCLIQTDQDVTLGDYLTCRIDATTASDNGLFGEPGFMGIGTAQALQTVDRSGTDGPVLAYLLPGPGQSGLVQRLTLPAAGGAVTCTPTGVTSVDSAVTLAANATYTLGAATRIGARKCFKLEAALTTNDLLITCSGVQQDDSTALASIAMDAANDITLLEWVQDKWKVVHNTGSTLNAS